MSNQLASPLPATADLPPEKETRIEAASQWLLMWWKFRKSRLAVIGGVVVIAAYLIAFSAEFFSPKAAEWYDQQYVYAPPQFPYFFLDGQWHPFVYGYRFDRDPRSLKKIFSIDYNTRIPFGFFVKGEPYHH